ncbi:MAG TPA: ABC transporter permease [Candidatus Acidoferrales bacterium]|jgi:putative ABC transport system permease protein|nr:ABC transporter permease [Candidatus Acidoferrales bacterium]
MEANFIRRLKRLFRREKSDAESASELRAYLETETAENIARGMSPEHARDAARRKLGNATRIREEIYHMNSLGFLETFLQDVRFALRMLRKNPSFTAIAILTLALGIGANTAIFSVVYAVLLRPLPYPDSGQLVSVFDAKLSEGIPRNGFSYNNFKALREQNSVFSELDGVQNHDLTLTGRGEPTTVHTAVVTPGMLSLFLENPIAGRTFRPEDGVQGAPAVVVLSENLWRSQFDAGPNIIGTAVDLDKRPFTVIGVMPASFQPPLTGGVEQIWIPVQQDPVFSAFMKGTGGHWLRLVGRLKPGVSLAQAQAEMDAMSARFAHESPAENTGWTFHIMPLQQATVREVRPALLVMLGAVGLVLLVACANIANLLLARATSRVREIALRIAIGAGRARIIRQLLTEAAVLGLFGGLAGIALAYWGVHALLTLVPENLPQVNAIHVDGAVLGFALLLSILAGIIFGLAPAFFAADSNLRANLQESGGRSGEGGRRRRARSILAIAEISLAMVLLVAAGLLVRSFVMLTSVNPGFQPQHILTAQISLPQFQYSKPEQWIAFSDDFLARVQAEPGLHDSAIALPLPLAYGFVNLAFNIVGSPLKTAGSSRTADYVSATPDYFGVMGIPLLRGRVFDQHDKMSSPNVVVISEALARVYFPNQDPLGKQLFFFGFPPGAPASNREIVGVVGDVRDDSLGKDPGPMVYLPYDQAPLWGAIIVSKTTLSIGEFAAAMRRDAGAIDKDLPVTDVFALPDAVSKSVAQPRFRTLLLGLFGAMALVLAAAGIFGVISYSVSSRTHEIGIRVALGAQRKTILWMVLRETLLLAAVGLAVGVPCALAASRLLGHMLFGVSAYDPATLAAVAFVLAAVAVFAGYVPARRAMRVDPIVALRHE